MFRRVDLDARAEKSRWIDLPTRARLDLSTATGVDKSGWVNMATGAEEFRLDDLAARTSVDGLTGLSEPRSLDRLTWMPERVV